MADNIELTTEHKEMVTQLLDRIRALYSQTSAPVGGWQASALSAQVNSLLELASTAIQPKTLNDKLSGYVSNDATSSEVISNAVVKRKADGNISLPQTASGDDDAVNKAYVDAELAKKSNTGHTHSQGEIVGLSATLSNKADAVHQHNMADINGLSNALAGKAAATHTHEMRDINGLSRLEERVNNKVDLVFGKVAESNIPNLPMTKINGLSRTLDGKINADGFKVSPDQLDPITTDKISNIDDFVSGKINSVVSSKIEFDQSGKISPASINYNQYPSLHEAASVSALPKTGLYKGAIGVIKSGEDEGTYWFNTDNATWVKLASGVSNKKTSVNSVNGKTGEVTLNIEEINGWNTARDGLEQLISDAVAASEAKPVFIGSVRVASHIGVTGLTGLKTIDGVQTRAGDVVLLSAQNVSSENGFWVVSATQWVRPTQSEFSSYRPNAIVAVSEGTANGGTLWRFSGKAVVNNVANGVNSWSKIFAGGGSGKISTGSGLSNNAGTISVKAGQGLTFSPDGSLTLQASTSVRKYTGVVPEGNRQARIVHNLNTTDVIYQVFDSQRNAVLVGATAMSNTTLSLDFANAPARNQYTIVVMG